MRVERYAAEDYSPPPPTGAIPDELTGIVRFSDGLPLTQGHLYLIPMEAAIDTSNELIEEAALALRLSSEGRFRASVGASWTACRSAWVTIYDSEMMLLDQRQIVLEREVVIEIPARPGPDWRLEGQVFLDAGLGAASTGHIELWGHHDRKVLGAGVWAGSPIDVGSTLVLFRYKERISGPVSLVVLDEDRWPCARVDAVDMPSLEQALLTPIRQKLRPVELRFAPLSGHAVAGARVFWRGDWYQPKTESCRVDSTLRRWMPGGEFMCWTEDQSLSLRGLSRFDVLDTTRSVDVVPSLVIPGQSELVVECVDANGRRMPNSPVRCELLGRDAEGLDVAGLFSLERYTEADGFVTFGGLAPGTYRVSGAKSGSGQVVAARSAVRLGSRNRVRVKLAIAEMTCFYISPSFAGESRDVSPPDWVFWRTGAVGAPESWQKLASGTSMLSSGVRGFAPGRYEMVVVGAGWLGRGLFDLRATATPQRFDVKMQRQEFWRGHLTPVAGSDIAEGLEVRSAGESSPPWFRARVSPDGNFTVMAAFGSADALAVWSGESHDVTREYKVAIER